MTIRQRHSYGVRDSKVAVEDIQGRAPKKPAVKTIKGLFKGIETPEGFSRAERGDVWGNHKTPVLVLEHPDGTQIEVKGYKDREGIASTGHVRFKDATGSSRTFDRRGVEDSFYVDPNSELAHLHDQANFAIKDAIERRIPEARERSKGMESIPGLPFRTNPKGKAEIAAKLDKGQSHTFMPSGFGTGYRLSKRKPPGGFSERADRKTERYFGVSPLYVDTFDAD